MPQPTFKWVNNITDRPIEVRYHHFNDDTKLLLKYLGVYRSIKVRESESLEILAKDGKIMTSTDDRPDEWTEDPSIK